MIQSLILLVLFPVLLLIALSTFLKVRKLHVIGLEQNVILQGIRRESEWLFAQLQAYLELEKRIKLDRSLPRLRGWAASPDFLLAIAEHSLDRKPVTCLECSSGVSTLILARCMQINGQGHVYSLEHEPYYAERTRSMLRQHGLETWATVIDAPLADIQSLPGHRWYSLQNLPEIAPVDLVVIDGPPYETCPMARYPVLGMLKGRLSSRFFVYLDDADRPDEQAAVNRWLAELPGLTQEKIDCEKGCVRLEHA